MLIYSVINSNWATTETTDEKSQLIPEMLLGSGLICLTPTHEILAR